MTLTAPGLLVDRAPSLYAPLLAALQRRAWLHGTGRLEKGVCSGNGLYYESVTGLAEGHAAAANQPPPHTAVVLHGLLGSGRNLRGMVAALCKQAAEQTGATWRGLLVDLRNHGKSAQLASLPPPHDLRCAAHDVVRLVQQQLGGRAPEALIGHSMGGKTALEVVRQLALPGAPVGQPKQVWVLDARPNSLHGAPDAATREVQHVLSTVQSIQLPLASRDALHQQLKERGLSTGLQQWLGSSLVPDGHGRFVWTFNVEGAAAMFDDYLTQDYSALLKSPPRGVTLHILRAMRSDRWDRETLAVVQGAVAATAQPAAVRGQTRYHELPDAGHWVHADNPKGLIKLLLPSLIEAAKQ
ncbi:hypothetical protein CHLNCDRAFT_137091 [Chlorella variabilis]|uniref:AB hydrolase-1 domain-containing protein n=1 Tax=Chlorella variabilis TaxID=554065 RepID=E1ZLZ4_CHLVA|nr:hypothetical protein CHLNCDRAFT_137091 [Chlorella variabilis]EFN53217.1 hypothetical protein CHLNCDRAFT_137091 [Chlorella variabilis]|eukprot:XP_005845319.1 hypothetical protein CHLNCDRAFT_137091 [Chlorella variabilis]